jgi:DedD protein
MAEENSQPIDYQELEFKKRARRRLVGSIALVLLMIVVLPMILKDKHPEPINQDLVISIPSETEQTPPATSPQTEQAAIVSNNQEPIAEQTQVEAPSVDKTSSASANSQETKANPTTASGSFNIQIGVFSDEKNTKQLQSKLESNGFAVLSQTFPNGKIRLRVGPYLSRAEADEAIVKLKSLKLKPMIVND